MTTNESMHVFYIIDGLNENENAIFETALVNGKGESFYTKNANVERLDEEEQTIISLVFPYSIWNQQQSLSLAVKDYEELKLVEKE